MERDLRSYPQGYFYPRPPRGGRHNINPTPPRWELISIHALREEGDLQRPGRRGGHFISIHALREEGDLRPRRAREAPGKFLSTPSARRATHRGMSRATGFFLFLSTPSARRATLKGLSWSHKLRGFLSTPSARRATPQSQRQTQTMEISIHALREEGDLNVSPGNTSST